MTKDIKDRLFENVFPGTPMRLSLENNGITKNGIFVYIGKRSFVEAKLEDNRIKYSRSQRIPLEQITSAIPVEPLIYYFGLVK